MVTIAPLLSSVNGTENNWHYDSSALRLPNDSRMYNNRFSLRQLQKKKDASEDNPWIQANKSFKKLHKSSYMSHLISAIPAKIQFINIIIMAADAAPALILVIQCELHLWGRAHGGLRRA